MKTIVVRLALACATAIWVAGCKPIEPAVTAPLSTATVAATVVAGVTPGPITLEQEELPDVVVDGSLPLRGVWRFAKVPSFTPDMAASGYDDSNWGAVEAPARWSEQGLAGDTGTGAVVVYRRTVNVPGAWAGQPVGISAWVNPYGTQVFVNGKRVEPLRTPFAPYADVSALVKPGETNTVAIVVQYDGKLDYADAGEARIGPIGTRPVTKVLRTEGTFATAKGDASYVLIQPAAAELVPALLLVASGSHGMAELSTWFDTAADLARQGYASMAVALPAQTAEGVSAAVATLRGLPGVNLSAIYLFGVDEVASAALDAAASSGVRGVIVLSPPMLQKLPDTDGLPLLLMAAEKDRGGLILNQLRKLAGPLGAAAQVTALPGDGHGTFLLTYNWNAVRDAVSAWLTANQAK